MTGMFDGLSEGALITDFLGTSLAARITYAGGTDNNDVVLTVNEFVTFNLESTASLSEDNEETATLTLTLDGGTLSGSNTASVTIASGGTASSGIDYDNFVTAISNKTGAIVGVHFESGTGILTFDSAFNGTGTGDFSFELSAINDENVEGTETIVATLSNPMIDDGFVSILNSTSITNITELDAILTLAISSIPSISEDDQETNSITLTLGGDALAGDNTAIVTIANGGTATSGDDYDDFFATIVNAAAATSGVSFDSGNGTLTFDSAFNGIGTGDFIFDLQAINDDIVEGTETLTVSLFDSQIDNGTINIGVSASDTTITELDIDLTISLSSTSDVSEDDEEIGRFTLTLGGGSLSGTNTAQVTIANSGTAQSGVDFDDFVTAIATQASFTPGANFDLDAQILTFDSAFNRSGTGSFAFDLQTINDQTVERTGTIIGTLSAATIDNGSVSLGSPTSTTNINELDTDLVFSVSSTDSISEDDAETSTFSLSVSGGALTGANTASIKIAISGTATGGSDYSDFVTEITARAGDTAGVGFDSGTGTLTFNSAFNGIGNGEFTFDLTAIDDEIVERNETIVAEISDATIDNGSASIDVASSSTDIVDLDAVVMVDAGVAANDLTDDVFEIRLNGAVLEVFVNGMLDRMQDFSDVDSINFSGGSPVPVDGIAFDGAGQVSDGDSLTLANGSFPAVIHELDSLDLGRVVIDGRTINYSALESLVDELDAVDREFNFGSSDNNITLSDNAESADGMSMISSEVSPESFVFTDPTGSLTINGGDGNDTVVADSIDSLFSAELTVNGGNGADYLDATQMDIPLTLNGDAGVDTLIGGSASDTLNGGSGHDVIVSDATDTLDAPLTQIDLVTVIEPTPTDAAGEIATLPQNVEFLDEWDSFFVEIYAQTPITTDQPIGEAFVDVTFDADLFFASGISFGPAFTEGQDGTIDNDTGRVVDVGGATNLTDVGDDAFVLVARIAFDPIEEHDIPNTMSEAYITQTDDESIGSVNARLRLTDVSEADSTLTLPLFTQIWPIVERSVSVTCHFSPMRSWLMSVSISAYALPLPTLTIQVLSVLGTCLCSPTTSRDNAPIPVV